jgi:DNA anti-recombination protein RmuC
VRRYIDWEEVLRYTELLRIDEQVVESLRTEWTIERGMISRRRSAADLLRDWEWGVITREQLLDELVALGYTRRDAVRMARQYLARRLDARAQRIMRAARQIEADAERRIAKAEKREREARRLAREAQIELERAREELQKRLEEARKEAERERKAAEEAVRRQLGEPGF